MMANCRVNWNAKGRNNKAENIIVFMSHSYRKPGNTLTDGCPAIQVSQIDKAANTRCNVLANFCEHRVSIPEIGASWLTVIISSNLQNGIGGARYDVIDVSR